MHMSTPQTRVEPQCFRKLSISTGGVLVQTIQFESLFDDRLKDIYRKNFILTPLKTETMISAGMSLKLITPQGEIEVYYDQ